MTETNLRGKISRRKFANSSALGAAALMCSPAFATKSDGSKNHSESILKTDTHVHLFDLNQFDYDWLKNVPAINRSFSLADFQDASRHSSIGDIVFMESGARVGLGIKEAKWVSSLAKSNPHIKGIVANIDIGKGLEVSEDLEQLLNLKLLRGIRCALPKNAHESSKYLKGIALLATKNLTFDLLASYQQLEKAAVLVAKCPNNIFILDHIGGPDIKSGELKIWKKGISKLASFPNVNCKISGIITKAGDKWNTDTLMPYVDHVVKSFGMRRLIYGGDWPVVLLGGTYLNWSSTFENLTNNLSENEKMQMYQTNARHIYNL